MTNSCYGCEKRELGCHSTCEDYKTFKNELERENSIKKEELRYVLDRINRNNAFKNSKANMVKKGFTKTKV